MEEFIPFRILGKYVQRVERDGLLWYVASNPVPNERIVNTLHTHSATASLYTLDGKQALYNTSMNSSDMLLQFRGIFKTRGATRMGAGARFIRGVSGRMSPTKLTQAVKKTHLSCSLLANLLSHPSQVQAKGLS